MALSAKQKRFVEEYLLDLNATQAAMRAGYSPRTARSQGQRLLTKVDIQSAIAEGQSALSARSEVNAEQVVRGLWREASREGNGSSHSARVQALGLLGKHLGIFEKTQALAVDVTSGGKPLERSCLTSDDLAAAAALVRAAGIGVCSDGGQEPLAAVQATAETEAISPVI